MMCIEPAARRLHEAYEERVKARNFAYQITDWEHIGTVCQREFIDAAISINDAVLNHDELDDQVAHLLALHEHEETPHTRKWWRRRIKESELEHHADYAQKRNQANFNHEEH